MGDYAVLYRGFTGAGGAGGGAGGAGKMTSGTGGRQGPNAAEIRLGPLRVQDLRGRPGTEYYKVT